MIDGEVNEGTLIRRVAKRSGVKQETVHVVLRAFYDEVAAILSVGGRVRITNFGVFRTRVAITKSPITQKKYPAKRFASWAPTGRIREVVAGTTEPGTLGKRPSGGQYTRS